MDGAITNINSTKKKKIMENSIIVQIEKILDKQTFTSSKTGNVYEKFFFVGKTQAQYPKIIAFSVMGKEKFEKLGIVVGKSYNISFDVESREWNGKFFTDITAWKAVCVDGDMGSQSTSNAVPQAQAAPQPTPSAKGDDLPF